MEMRVIGIDLGKSVFPSGGDGSAREGSVQEAAFAFSDDGLYGEDSTLLNRYGSVLWQSLCWCGFDGAGTRRQAHAGTVCEAIPEVQQERLS